MRILYLLALIACLFKLTNSRTSTLWRLNTNGKITAGNEEKYPRKQNRNAANTRIEMKMPITTRSIDLAMDVYSKDHIFYIIASTLNEGGSNYNGWTRLYDITQSSTNNRTSKYNLRKESTEVQIENQEENRLDCGKPVNYTKYDHLIGIGQRHYYHPPAPEPEVAYFFLGVNDEYAYRNFDLAALERKLTRAKRKHENITFELYTDIGNYFRIIGDTRQTIECFRHAITLRDHPVALLNLARVMYNLEYYSDAILLSLDSINSAPKNYVPWQEYFILGEIFKASGRVQESTFHLKRALELNPHHEPILKVLRDVENSVLSSLHIYTLVIIIALVFAVFVVVISSASVGSNVCTTSVGFTNIVFLDGDFRPQRHFNRAMAMRSLKGLTSNGRFSRHRRF